MSIQETLRKQIAEIERRISEDKEDVESLKRVLQQLRMQEFEEDLRESDNRQFLRD